MSEMLFASQLCTTSGAGGALPWARVNNFLSTLPLLSDLLSRPVSCKRAVCCRRESEQQQITNNNKDTHHFTPDHTRPPISRKRTRPAHQAGHMFAILEPARAFCTTRHARIEWNGGLHHTCTARSL